MAPLYPQRNEVGPWLPCVRGAVRRSGLRGCPLGVGGKGKGPAVPFPSLRTEPALRAAPVFRSAYSASRNAPASAASRPPSEHTVLFLPKRSCFRFASLTLRTPHRSPVSSPLAAAAALWLPCVRGAVRRRAGLRGCLRIRGKVKGRRPSPVSAPNRLFKPLRCSGRLIRQAETLELQPHSRPPSKHTVLFLPKRSCFSRFAASEPRTVLPFLLH